MNVKFVLRDILEYFVKKTYTSSGVKMITNLPSEPLRVVGVFKPHAHVQNKDRLSSTLLTAAPLAKHKVTIPGADFKFTNTQHDVLGKHYHVVTIAISIVPEKPAEKQINAKIECIPEYGTCSIVQI
jgi:hypothetical protein